MTKYILLLLGMLCADSMAHENLLISGGPRFDFGYVAPASTRRRTFTITNQGWYQATNITGLGLAAPYSFAGGFPGTGGTCGTTLNFLDSCTFTVDFAPAAATPAVDQIQIDYTYGDQPLSTQSVYRDIQGNAGCILVPIISTITPGALSPSSTRTITITGNYLTSTSSVSVPGLSTSNFSYVSPTEVQVDVTSLAALQYYDVEVTNECGTTIQTNGILTKQLTGVWVDLRSGGDPDAELGIQMRSGLTYTRDITGMYFGGTTSGWGNWVHFTTYEFTRGDQSSFQIVFTKNSNSNFMLGIGSDEQDFNSASQWNQAETEFYTFNMAAWGYYGNNGTPGNTWTQGIGSLALIAGNYYKVRFNNDGGTGNNVVLTQVLATNWDTELATINTVVSTNTANATNLRPMVLPNTLGTSWRVVGFRLD